MGGSGIWSIFIALWCKAMGIAGRLFWSSLFGWGWSMDAIRYFIVFVEAIRVMPVRLGFEFQLIWFLSVPGMWYLIVSVHLISFIISVVSCQQNNITISSVPPLPPSSQPLLPPFLGQAYLLPNRCHLFLRVEDFSFILVFYHHRDRFWRTFPQKLSSLLQLLLFGKPQFWLALVLLLRCSDRVRGFCLHPPELSDQNTFARSKSWFPW